MDNRGCWATVPSPWRKKGAEDSPRPPSDRRGSPSGFDLREVPRAEVDGQGQDRPRVLRLGDLCHPLEAPPVKQGIGDDVAVRGVAPGTGRGRKPRGGAPGEGGPKSLQMALARR